LTCAAFKEEQKGETISDFLGFSTVLKEEATKTSDFLDFSEGLRPDSNTP